MFGGNGIVDAHLLANLRLMAPNQEFTASFVAELRDAGADVEAAEQAAVSLANVLRMCKAEDIACATPATALPTVLCALRTHAAHREISTACLLFLLELLNDNAAAAARDAGAVEAAAAALQAHAAHTRTVETACKALMALRPVPDEASAAARFAVAIPAALAALRSAGISDPFAAKQCCNLVTLLMRLSPQHTRRLCDGGVVSATLAAMGAHPLGEYVQAQGVTVLVRTLEQLPSAIPVSAHGDVLAAVFVALCGHAKKSDDVLRSCCSALLLLPDAGASRAARLGGVEAFCAALKAHHARPAAVSAFALCRVLHFWFELAPETRRRALAAGVATWLVSVLNELRGDADLQRLAAAAFAQLTADADVGDMAACGSAGAIEAAVATMAAHRRNAEVEQFCVRLLSNLCVTAPVLRARAIKAGVLPLLVGALRNTSGSRILSHCCLSALANICSNDDDNKRAAAAAGVVEVVVAALKASIKDAELTRAACYPLLNICLRLPPNQQRAVAAGAIPALLAALRTHALNPDVGAKIGMALSNTMGRSTEHRLAAGPGAIKELVAAMRAHPTHSELLQYCSVALGALCTDLPEHQAAACAAGALQLFVAALRAHPTDATLQCHTAHAMANLVAGQLILTKKAGAMGAVETAVAALRLSGVTSVGNANDLLYALGHLGNAPANAARAIAAGAFAAVVAVQQAMAATPAPTEAAWEVASMLVGTGPETAAEAAVAAGLLSALVACLGTDLADAQCHPGVHTAGARLLRLLCEHGGIAVALELCGPHGHVLV